MKIPRVLKSKKIIIPSSVAVLAVAGGAVFALNGTDPVQQKDFTTTNDSSTASQEAPESTEEQKTTMDTTPTQTTPKPAAKAPTTQSTPPPAPAPDQGILVSNKTQVMTDAGIAPADHANADKVISHLSGWYYKEDGSKNLCAVIPTAKMSPFGADYQTNPVTQMKYCNGWAVSREGGWAGWAARLGL